ncbi:hypothetical protein [Paenibacillus sp.]|uniref:glycan biosynthesis hexose transferase WsfD n=1 Tax=Paenibacillus sp. TaxID=58172 RepID=UPI0028119EF0|nr:hypothetical protein [Paenibacillus sp.]
MAKRRADVWIGAALAAAALALLYFGIMHRPVVGMADNGDFLRVMKTAGFDYASDGLTYEDKYFDYAILQFRNAPLGFGGYASTHLLLLFVAKAANALLHPGGLFQITSLGAVYAACFAAAIVLIYRGLQANRATKLVVAALLVAVYTDVAYAAYYHSFYGEPVSLIGFLLAIGCGLHAARAPGRFRLWAYFAAAVLFMGAKSQNFAVGLVFCGSLLALGRAAPGPRTRKLALALSAAVLLLTAAFYAAAPKELKKINLYQTVFYGVLKHSDDVPADLRELGLPAELAPLAGTNFFEAGTAIPQTSPALDALFYDRIGHLDVALYYAKHPRKLLERLERAADDASTIRPYYLGNYAEGEGRGPGAVHLKGAWWSEGKKAHMPRSVYAAAAVAALYTALLASRRVAALTGLRAHGALYGAPFIAAIAYVTPLLGDGDADLAKHLFLYNVAFDFMAVCAAGLAAVCFAHAAAAAAKRLYRRTDARQVGGGRP